MNKYDKAKDLTAKSKSEGIKIIKSVSAQLFIVDSTTRIVKEQNFVGIVQINKVQSTKTYFLSIYKYETASFVGQFQIQHDFYNHYSHLWNHLYIIKEKIILQFEEESASIINQQVQRIVKKKTPFFGICFGRPPREKDEIQKDPKGILFPQKNAVIIGINEKDSKGSNRYLNKRIQACQQSYLNPQAIKIQKMLKPRIKESQQNIQNKKLLRKQSENKPQITFQFEKGGSAYGRKSKLEYSQSESQP